MVTSLISALQPAGLVLAGAGLGSLLFSGPLAKLDDLLHAIGVPPVDPDHSRKWVEVAGATWGMVGVALLMASHFLG